jgi:hypothetical protein
VAPQRIEIKENIRYATFSVTAAPVNDIIDFKTSGTAFAGFDYIATLQWSSDGGDTWNFYNQQNRPTWLGTTIDVRVAIINDTKPEPVESIIVEVSATPTGLKQNVEIYLSDG